MIKKYWKLLLVTSLVILLPMVVGILLWDKLPEQIPTHWNSVGEVDRWSSKPFAIFGMSGLMLGIQWLCVLGTSADPKKRNHPEKILHLILWIVPVLTVLLFTITYIVALGKEVRMEIIMPVSIGLILTIVGNYLPKCKQNYTIGIKIPWTLNSEENWNRTHRFTGRLWVICGILIMLSGFFSILWAMVVCFFIMIIVPVMYSYLLYRKGV